MLPIVSTIAALAAFTGAVNSLSLPRDDSYAPASKAYLYFLQNQPSGASIVAMDAASKGKGATVTATGGKGRALVNPDGQVAVVDTLNSQGAVTIEGNLLFTVNAGSNTVSMFKINPANPLHPTLVGYPTDTLGDFPVSVAYSTALQQACVLNGGTRNSVTCFKVDANKGLTALGPARSLNLTIANPPVFGSGLASQVSFSPDSSLVIATVKGPNGSAGSYFVWPVHRGGRISQQAVVTKIADMPDAFGFAFDPTTNNRLFVSDASYGGSLVTLGKDLKVTEGLHQNESDALVASCWVVYSSLTKKFYAAPAGTPVQGIYDSVSGVYEGTVDFDKKLMGAFDTVMDPRDNRTMYFLAGVDVKAIGVADVVKKMGTGSFSPMNSAVGDRQYWEGLAIYVPKY